MSEQDPKLEALFEAAVRIVSPEERAAFLDSRCGQDADLRNAVELLLCSDEEAGSFLETGPPELGANRSADSAGDNLMASLGAGLSPAFGPDAAVVIGRNDHSIVQALSRTIDISSVSLRESDAEHVDPIQQPRSAEIPNRDATGRYQLQGEIARGGMGAILKGRDIDLGRELAIKVLLDEHKNKPEVIQRFVEEAQIGGQLQHPGIAPVYELGQFSDQRPFFSMKLVKGKTLAAILAERSDANEDRGRLLGIFEQVCQTMAYAHSRGVIHRDLKPANIMVGFFGEVQVMDWGLAKVLKTGGVADEQKSRDKQSARSIIRTLRSVGSDASDAVDGVGSQTVMGSVMGTPAYMPPEQALGEIDDLDERADVFGLGAILCEILTGNPPYVAEGSMAIHRLACRGKLDECLQRLENCEADRELVALAKNCLQLEPASRPRDAGELSERISSYLESVETKLRETELQRVAESARVEEEQKRRRVTTALAASVLLFVLLGSGGWLYFERQASDVLQQHATEIGLANDDLNRSLDRQKLAAAFSAYNDRNVEEAQALLRQVSPKEESADSIAWRFLDARCKESLGEVRKLNHEVHARSAIDPLGRFYAAAVADNQISLMSLSGELLARLSFPEEGLRVLDRTRLTISSDGRWLLAPVSDGEQAGRVLIWELFDSEVGITAKAMASSPLHDSPAICADMDVESNQVVSIDLGGTIKTWSIASGDLKTVEAYPINGAPESGVYYSNDGNWILSHQFRSVSGISVRRSDDLTATVMVPYADQVSRICFAPNSNRFAIAGYSGTEIWDLNEGDPRRVHRTSWRRSTECAFSSDGRHLVVCGTDDYSIEVFSVDTGETARVYHWSDINDEHERLDFTENGVFAIGRESAVLCPGFLGSRVETQSWWYAPFATGGSRIAVPTADEQVRVLDVLTNEEVAFSFDEPPRRIRAIGLSSDGGRIAISTEGAGRNRIFVWDIEPRRLVYVEDIFPGPLTLIFSPANRDLLFNGMTGYSEEQQTTKLVNLDSGESITVSDDAAIGAEFCGDGTKLLLGGSPWRGDGNATVWDVSPKGEVKLRLELDTRHNYSVSFRSDGGGFALLDGKSPNNVRVWDELGERSFSPILVSSPRLLSLDYSPGGECIVTASPNGQITFIDSADGEEVGVFRVDHPLRHLEFMDNHKRLVVSTMDGAVLHWDY